MRRWIIPAGLLMATALFVALNAGAPRGAYDPLSVLAVKIARAAWGAVFWMAVLGIGTAAVRVGGRAGQIPEVALAFGISICALGAMGVAAAGLAYGWVVKGVGAAIAVGGAICFRDDYARWVSAVREGWGRAAVGTALLGAFAAAVLLPQALGACHPPTAGPALGHYLVVPKVISSFHKLPPPAYDWYASAPMMATALGVGAYLFDGITLAAANHMVFSLLAVALTYRVARVVLDQSLAALAAVVTAVTPAFYGGVSEAGGSHGALALGLAAVYLTIGPRADAPDRGLARHFGAGVLMGAAVADRYAGLPLLIMTLILLVYRARADGIGPTRALAFVLGTIVYMAPWCLKAYAERGDPFFPLGYGWAGARGISREAMARWAASWGVYGTKVTADRLLGLTSVLAPAALPLTLTMAALSLGVWRKGRIFAIAAWVAFELYLLLPDISGREFTSAATPFLAIAAAGGIAAATPIGTARAARWWRRAAGAALVLAAIPFNVRAYLAPFQHFLYFVIEDKEVFLAERSVTYGGAAYLNENSRPHDKVLLLYHADALYLEREAVYAVVPTASPFLTAAGRGDAAGLYRECRRRGITYVFISREGEKEAADVYGGRATGVVREFLSRYGASVYDDGWSAVFELI